MPALPISAVLDALRTVVDPNNGRNLVRLGWIRELSVSSAEIRFTLWIPDPMHPFAGEAASACEKALVTAFGDSVAVNITTDSEMIDLGADLSIDGREATPGPGEGITSIVAVASGKGGVGKSTVASNLAVALAQQEYDVGLVDVDIYGPSIPTMFGIETAKPRVNEKRRIIPVEKYGVKLLSMGFLVDPEKAVIWRGPMVTSAVRQFLSDTEWGELDYLIMDLPPGTGDIQLTIVQTIPLAGAVIVSTPQRVALADARKGVSMFDQVGVPVLGIVENMAYFTPDELPDKRYYLFGQGGAKALAGELDVPFLGEVPLVQAVRENADEGTPVAADASSPVGEVFRDIAADVAVRTEERNALRPATQKIDVLHR